jgi:branched-chain amino acid transport system permease protein
MSGGRLDAAILRQLLVAVAMIGIMLMRPRGLWPSPRLEDRLMPDEGAAKAGGGA